MTVITLLLALVCIGAGLFFLRAAARGVPALARTWRRSPRPIAKLDAGGVEVAGIVTAVGEPLLTLSGQPVVALRTLVAGAKGSGKQSVSTGERQVDRAVQAFLEDASGKCRLDLEHRAVVGETQQARLDDVGLLDAVPWAKDLVPPGSTSVTITQTFIAVGAKVLVTGSADRPRARPTDTYRDGKLEWTVSGSSDDLLVISVGSVAWFFARALVPVLGLVLVSSYLVALGALIIAFVQS